MVSVIGNGNRDFRVVHNARKLARNFCFQVLDGKTGGMHPARQWQTNVALMVHVDNAEVFRIEFRQIDYINGEPVIWTEYVAPGGRRGCVCAKPAKGET